MVTGFIVFLSYSFLVVPYPKTISHSLSLCEDNDRFLRNFDLTIVWLAVKWIKQHRLVLCKISR